MANVHRQQYDAMTVAVIGAPRGLGRELGKQLAKSTDTQSITLYITDDASVTAAAKTVSELDLLIVNAAMGSNDTLLNTSSDDLVAYLSTKVIGPHRVIKAFLPALLTVK
ncbi:hypothetical protein BKA65DRAFT_593392 [Rhexocercosporidium sp. MPI-PUGE-AT-0058]|nr:hypothetical protein BKA65DRAFT_593392 [Rhexocercosporidium sp. MPI-PUGE-AT-0058]